MKTAAAYFVGKFLAGLVQDRWNNEHELMNVIDPVLIIHGKQDTIVPYRCSEQLFNSCISTKKILHLSATSSHNEWNYSLDLIK
jgi:esterase/lipase